MDCGVQALIGGSEPLAHRTLSATLAECGLQTVLTSTTSKAITILARREIALTFHEANLTDGSFRDNLRTVQQKDPNVPVVVTCQAENLHEYLEDMQLGASGFNTSP